MDQQNTILDLRNVVKRFGGITASNNISIHVPQGSIYGVVGPNGAGKTTLFNMITGVYDTTEGEIVFDGEKINGLPTHIIAQKGIARTFQNIRLFGDLSVYDNLLTACQKNITYSLFDGFLRTPNCRRQEKAARAECDALLEEMELTTQSGQKASNLPYGMQRKLEIARALATHPKVLLLDEPAAGMNEEESVQLSAFIRNIRDSRDLTIVIIDHHMDVIMSICDRVSVYRDGQYIGSGDTKDLDEAQLIKMMVGREITDVFPKLEAEIGDVVFEAKNIVRADNKVKGVSLSVRRGEILGIGGLVGAGRSELVEGIFGMHELASGEIFVKGKQVKVHSPKDIIKEGVALITEDRKVTGLNLSGSVNDNIAMVAIKKLLSHGLYNKNKARAASMEYIKKLNIKTPSGDQITGNLSGGNQQKIVIAKWLLNDPDIIILDEPTRGIDVGAKRDIYLLLGKLVQQGKAVIMISSEIPELMGVCDRIMVMCEGNLSGEVQRDAFSQERIMTLASAIEV